MKKLAFSALCLASFLISCGVSEKSLIAVEQTLMDVRDSRSLKDSATMYSSSLSLKLKMDKGWEKHPLRPQLDAMVRSLGALGRSADDIRKGEAADRDLTNGESQTKEKAAQLLELLRR